LDKRRKNNCEAAARFRECEKALSTNLKKIVNAFDEALNNTHTVVKKPIEVEGKR